MSNHSEAMVLGACVHGRGAHGCADCNVRLVSVCAALAPDELAEFEAMNEGVAYAARTHIFSQEDEADNVFNVTDGVVRLFRLLPDGRRQIVGFALPGDFLGLALLDHYGVSADAVTDVMACRFQRRTFTAYLDRKPHLVRRLHEMTMHELSLAQEQMVLLGRRSAEERLSAFLLGMRERFARLGHHSVTLPLPMSRQDIADYLGLTIETVSRTFTKLARDKALIIVPDGVRITDFDHLSDLAAN